MIDKIKKILYVGIIFAILWSANVFADNLDLSISYGINNVAKNGSLLPLELHMENRENERFEGYVNITVFETNRSAYLYTLDLEIEKRERVIRDVNVSIANKTNTIVVEVYNDEDELVVTERVNIDLSYFDDRLIIGVLSDSYNTLQNFDDILLYNNSLKTKLVELNDELFINNKNIFDQVDAILISDINLTKFGESFNYALNNAINNGKPVIVALGGNNSAYAMPSILYQYIYGPTFDETINLNLTTDETEKVSKEVELNVTRFHLLNSKNMFEFNNSLVVESINFNNNLAICLPFSLNDISEYKESEKIFSKLIEDGFGKNKIDRILGNVSQIQNNDYYNINNLLNIIEKLKLPDIFIVSILLLFYIMFLTIILYVFLRNINKKKYYGRCAIVFSIIFTFVMFAIGYKVMKKNTSLNYISIVDLRDGSSKERAFLSFRTNEKGSYKFDTSANNKLYPILHTTNMPIMSANFLDLDNVKVTEFMKHSNRFDVEVNNASAFDSNMFVYENSNYISDDYNIYTELKRYDGEVTGHITNNMGQRIENASIYLYGRAIKIGNIDPGHSVSILKAENFITPINNNYMTAEILDNSKNQNIVKYYLDENIYQYFDYGILFGYIENNETIDIKSNDIGDSFGRTLIAKRIKIINYNDDELYDICSMENEVNNLYGYYDYANNSTNGDTEVMNEYYFDTSYKIDKIYFENLSNYEHGDLGANVPFYGSIAVYNVNTMNYDSIYNDIIDQDEVSNYLLPDNGIIIRYEASSKDVLYRKISLPVIRAIAEKIND